MGCVMCGFTEGLAQISEELYGEKPINSKQFVEWVREGKKLKTNEIESFRKSE